MKGRAWEAPLQGARLGTRARRKAQEKREAGASTWPPGHPRAPQTPWSRRRRSADLTVWTRIGSRGWRCSYSYRSGRVDSFSLHPLYCQEKGNMEKGKGNCPCSLCISKTRVLQIPFRSFSSGEKNPVMWVSRNSNLLFRDLKAAAAAKSLQSCPTLCDRIDGSPPGSSVPRILQARILEWVAILN